jgi:integrase
MAHIEKRIRNGRTTWRTRYRGPDGLERSQTFSRRSDAERFATTVEADKLRGAWVDPSLAQTSFEKWTQRWWDTTVALKPKTRAGYDSLLRTHILPTFATAPLARIQPIDVREWVAELVASGLSGSRVRQSYNVLSAILKAAVASGYLVKSPCVGVKLPQQQRHEMLFLSDAEVARLALSIAAPYDTLVYVLTYGGLRWGEAAALRRPRCDLERGRLEVAESVAEINGTFHYGSPKTYARRRVALPAFVRDRLADHLSRVEASTPHAFVFTTTNGAPLRLTNFRRRVWIPAVARAGLHEDLRIHDLRHTCASLMVRHGANIKAVQQQLGHSTPMVTLSTYTHLFEDDMERVMEGLDRGHREALAAPPRPERGPEVVELQEKKVEKGF